MWSNISCDAEIVLKWPRCKSYTTGAGRIITSYHLYINDKNEIVVHIIYALICDRRSCSSIHRCAIPIILHYIYIRTCVVFVPSHIAYTYVLISLLLHRSCCIPSKYYIIRERARVGWNRFLLFVSRFHYCYMYFYFFHLAAAATAVWIRDYTIILLCFNRFYNRHSSLLLLLLHRRGRLRCALHGDQRMQFDYNAKGKGASVAVSDDERIRV